jgi:molecular chaperone GrpE
MSKDKETDEEFIFEDNEPESSSFKQKSSDTLKEQIKELSKEKQEYLEGWQRARADLINFKRESVEGSEQRAKFATENLIQQILPTLDTFDIALEHMDSEKDKVGIRQVYKQLLGVLTENGVEQINPLGEQFNPNEHEALKEELIEDKSKDQTITEVLKKGYALHKKIIRPAQVTVATLNK